MSLVVTPGAGGSAAAGAWPGRKDPSGNGERSALTSIQFLQPANATLRRELAKAELAGLHAEKKLTQRFRAPQTLAILSAAHTLLGDVHAAAQPTAGVEDDERASLLDAIEEVRPMVEGVQGEDDELDDEI